MNQQACHEQSARALVASRKPAAIDDKPDETVACVSRSVRMAAGFVEAVDSNDVLCHLAARALVKKIGNTSAFALEVLNTMAQSGMVCAVERMQAPPPEAGALPEASQASAQQGRGRKRRRAQAVAPDAPPAASMVDWSVNRAAVTWIRRSANDSLPDVKLAVRDQWPDNEFCAEVLSWMQVPAARRRSVLRTAARSSVDTSPAPPGDAAGGPS